MQHLKLNHSGPSKRIMEDYYKCRICKFECTTLTGLNKHNTNIHEEDQIYHCTHCTKSFLLNKSLLRHKRNEHNDLPNKVYRCIQEEGKGCGKIFKLKESLKKHTKETFCEKKKKSSPNKVYKCMQEEGKGCGKVFQDRSCFKRHTQRTLCSKKHFNYLTFRDKTSEDQRAYLLETV